MQRFELQPLEGAGNIKLGASKSDVHAILGEPISVRGKKEFYFSNSVQISYSSEGSVEFIEFASDISVTWNGLDVFSTPVDELVELVSKFSSPAAKDFEPGYTFTFPESEVGFWRPTQPDEYDPEEGKYFESVGLGRKGYYSDRI